MAYAIRIRPGCSRVKAAAIYQGQQGAAYLNKCTKVCYISNIVRKELSLKNSGTSTALAASGVSLEDVVPIPCHSSYFLVKK